VQAATAISAGSRVEEFNVDSKADYSAYSASTCYQQQLNQPVFTVQQSRNSNFVIFLSRSV